jgi:molybdate/tungstate transport system substrate-binding protein
VRRVRGHEAESGAGGHVALVLLALLVLASAAYLIERPGGGPNEVRILAAGSLVHTYRDGLIPAYEKAGGSTVHLEARGSEAASRLVQDGLRRPDVFVSAAQEPLAELHASGHASWWVAFASDAMVLATSPQSVRGQALITTDDWPSVVTTAGFRTGRTDPALDPKGWRAWIVAGLAEEQLGRPGFRASWLGPDDNPLQVAAEETLVLRLEEGAYDAAFMYRHEAIERGLAFREMGPALDLSDPSHASDYARHSWQGRDGTLRQGAPIRFALTIPHDAPSPDVAMDFALFQLSEPGLDVLHRHGFILTGLSIGGDESSLPARLQARLGLVEAA